jgi:alpha-1,2-mannosyltransferase
VIYARAGATAEKMVQDAASRFNVHLDRPVSVVPLERTALVLPESYPRFTLLGQAWGAARLGHEALSKMVPEVRKPWIDLNEIS